MGDCARSPWSHRKTKKPCRGKAAIRRVSSGGGAPSPVRQPQQPCVATSKRGLHGVERAFRPFPRVAGPLGGPSSHHPPCGWCMMLFLWRTSCRGEVSPSAHTEPRRAPCTRALWCRAHSNSTCRKHAREVLGEGQDAILSADDQMVCRMTGHATCHPCL